MEQKLNSYNEESIIQNDRIPVCVCEENGRKYTLNNKSNLLLTKVKVDGGIITEGERCDFAIDAEAKEIFLIELKGSDKPHACSQILTTFNFFLKNYNSEKWHARIILSKNRAPKLPSNDEKRLIKLQKQRSDFDYIIKNVEYQESI